MADDENNGRVVARVADWSDVELREHLNASHGQEDPSEPGWRERAEHQHSLDHLLTPDLYDHAHQVPEYLDDLLAEELKAGAVASARLDRLVKEQQKRLYDGHGRIDPEDPRWALMVGLAKDLVRSGLEIHDCLADAPGGGVCLTPTSSRDGILVTWTQHDAAYHSNRPESRGHPYTEVQDIMSDTLCDLLITLGYAVEGYGPASANLVTGKRPQAEPQEEEPDAD